MRNKVARILAATAIVAFAALTATDGVAGELVRFVDGRYLEIEEHAVYGEAIRLTVETGGVLVFAADRVEWIERAGLRVLGDGPAETAAGRPPSNTMGVSTVTVDAGDSVRRTDADRPIAHEVARDFARDTRSGLRPIR